MNSNLNSSDIYFNNVTSVIKLIARNKVKKNGVIIDATLGNGNDILYLLKLLDEDGFAYGFDVQKLAIENTKIKLKEIDSRKYLLINDGHENIDKYIKEKINFVVYNLGYLPKSNHKIITRPETTVLSIKKSMDLLEIGGCICIASYISHDNGHEYNYLCKFIKGIDQSIYNVLEINFINQINLPPHLFVIERRKEKKI